jgi:hypothetical protein
LNIPDAVILVDLLQIYQWDALTCVEIHKEDLICHVISCNDEREVDGIKSVCELNVPTFFVSLDRLPFYLVEVFACFQGCAVTTYIWLNLCMQELLVCNLYLLYAEAYFF